MHNENKPLLALMFFPMTMELPVTKNAQKLRLVNHFPVRRNILARGREEVHLGGG